MHKQKREAARTRKNKSAHFTKSDVIAARGIGQSKSPALEKLTLKLTVPQNFPALLNALAKFNGQTPEQYTLEALCSLMLCDAECFDKDAREILAAIRGGSK